MEREQYAQGDTEGFQTVQSRVVAWPSCCSLYFMVANALEDIQVETVAIVRAQGGVGANRITGSLQAKLGAHVGFQELYFSWFVMR